MNEQPSTYWDSIYRRLESLRGVVETGTTLNDDERRRILQKRARELAKRNEETPEVEQIEIVAFVVAHESYGVEASFVREVYPLKGFSPLPGVPAFVLGITNVRGEIMSVINLKRFFGLPEKGITELNKVIILRSASMQFGVLADSILGSRLISRDAVQPPPATFAGIHSDYLRGVTGDRMAILDAEKLLADPKLVINDQMENSTGTFL